MNPGICLNPYIPHGWRPPIPAPVAYKDLHDLGIRTLRVGCEPLLQFARPPATIDDEIAFDFSIMDMWLMPILGAAPGGTTKPWMFTYLNPCGCPPWASEGQPTYISGITRWPPESPVTRESYVGDAWWNNPDDPSHGIHAFNQDPNRTDSVVDAVTGKTITGPQLAAIDQKMPARPYLKIPTHRDPQYAFDLGRQLVSYYRHKGLLQFVGSDNEPGGDILARYEARLGGKDSDLMRTRRFPEIYEPFARGVRSAAAGVTIVGCEADSADVLARFLDADDARYRGRPALSVCDKISIHPYGSVIDQAYSTVEAFAEVLKGRQSYRQVTIGEIDHVNPQVLYDFTVMVLAKYPWISDIYYLNPGRTFYEPGSSWETPAGAGGWHPEKSVLSPIGKKFQTLFAEMNRQRPVMR